ncbi:MAG: glycosyltransferase [Eubacteriales bacterium]|nr:glycosyltransferase [Eubacteriales bacterium]MDD4583604.1 glycosyltransferase [Eubacteriales bacterium]
MLKQTIGVFNDSFPPTIDGVANAVANYALEIQRNHGNAVVATPWYPGVTDDYPFEVIRYSSANVSKKLGYRAGNPFDPSVLKHLKKMDMDIIHSHCPFSSTVLARLLRFSNNIPIVFTYHTKFDIEFEKVLPYNPVKTASAKFLLTNINACDEVWTVSHGAGENLKSFGYKGDYIIMENGTDFPKGKADPDLISKIKKQHNIKTGIPIFLFVGRMMWYKGNRLTIDSLKIVKQRGYPFKMLFVGDGIDRLEIQNYARKCGLEDDCIFTGPIYDREIVRAYFSLADLFLFPSTYDTNGIVVAEAAACSCPSLLIEGSCAAEKVTNMRNALLAEENAMSIADAIIFAFKNPDIMQWIGENAADEVYLSWKDAVAKAYDRYQIVLDNYHAQKDLPSRRLAFLEEIHNLKAEFGFKEEAIKDIIRQIKKGS